MDTNTAVAALAALAQPTRLKVFRLLVRRGTDGIAAGQIAKSVKVPHNTLSTHLAILVRARLATLRREGRSQIYAVDLDGFLALLSYLAKDCCGSRPEVCAPLVDILSPCCAPKIPTDESLHV